MQGHKQDEFQLRFGLLDVTDGDHDQERYIKQIKRHPDYDKSNLDHDLALVELDEKLELNEKVTIAQLPCGKGVDT